MVRLNGRLAFNALTLSAFVLLLAWFFGSEEFYVTQVTVTGNQRVPADVIARASGLYGFSIFWLNSREVADQICDAVPPIRRVEVAYALPNLVKLRVEEEGQQFAWEVAGVRYWVDEEGKLHPMGEGADTALVVRDVQSAPPEQIDTQILKAVRQVAYLLPEVRTLEYEPAMGLRFTHRRGWTVYLGHGNELERKVSILRAVEAQFADREIVEPVRLDLRYPGGVFWRSQSGGGEGN